jgi:CubicO group peptidase (beta-lactamase class C family)
VVYTWGNGYADKEKGLVPDADTLYCIASCSKAFTTATCGILVDESKLSWTEPISTYLPDFQTPHDPEIGRRATLLDICSHRTGLAPLDHAGIGFHDELLNKREDQVKIAANLPVCFDFRSHWLYNNWMLGVASDIVSKITKSSAGTVLRERIFKPLNMTRSCAAIRDYPEDGNIARGYSVLDDGSLFPLEHPRLEDGDIMGGAGYVRSTVNEMLIWAKAVMEAEAREAAGPDDSHNGSPSSPLKQILQTRSAQIPIAYNHGGYEQAYGLGWFRHMLPSEWLGSIGANFPLLPDPPVIGKGGPPRLAIAHYGELGGFVTAFYTFPDTCSAVVVMANSSPARGDPSDLAAQALCQALFKMEPYVSIEKYAKEAANAASSIWPMLVEEWVSKRVHGTQAGPTHEYVGKYVNEGLQLTVDVFALPPEERGKGPTPEELGFNINSLKRQGAKLRHYHYDIWTFLPDSRDDAVRKGMEGYLRLPLILLSFMRGIDGNIKSLEWDLQAGACEGPAPGLAKAVPPVVFQRK